MEKIDRTGWGAGPWDEEGDFEVFDTQAGYLGVVDRNSLGSLCGYIAVPNGHPWHGVDYDNIHAEGGDYVEVHGGLTYSRKNSGEIGTPDTPRSWWVGFDCAHLGDLVPAMIRLRDVVSVAMMETYRDFKYVKEEIESLAQQAKDALVALQEGPDA
ncbi:MAG TPA: hypothetical protein VNA25_05065 [Phycisphaerae bacterium]|nr:hypothetical protein [Phycisphaerae bacterium]